MLFIRNTYFPYLAFGTPGMNSPSTEITALDVGFELSREHTISSFPIYSIVQVCLVYTTTEVEDRASCLLSCI